MVKFIDLFAGTGGIRLAFEQACREFGIESQCVFSSEIDQQACESYELNFGTNPYSDVTEVDELPDFEFLLAGFPCQAFSYAGKRKGFGDTRGTLFFEVERILKQKRPACFLLENVRGLVTHDKGRTFKTITDSLEKLGYSVDHLLLNSSNFGLPQNRVRIYIVGVLNAPGELRRPVKLSLYSDLGAADTHRFKSRSISTQISLLRDGVDTAAGNSQISAAIATQVASQSFPRVQDILEPEPDTKYRCSKDFVNKLGKIVGDDFSRLHGYRLIDFRGGKSLHSWELGVKGECTPEEIEFMNLLISNRRKKHFGTHQDGKSLTKAQIQTFYKEDNFEQVTQSLIEKGYLSCHAKKYNPVCGNMSFEVFKFLDPEGISITLTASDANRLGVVQNNIPRRITPRECARLQGYPGSYQLLANDNAVYKQMGNGVSVPVVKAVLSDFIAHNLPHPLRPSKSFPTTIHEQTAQRTPPTEEKFSELRSAAETSPSMMIKGAERSDVNSGNHSEIS